MNRYEVAQAVGRHRSGTIAKAVLILQALVEETDGHSDGWSSWPLPGRAARKLMELIGQANNQLRNGVGPTVTDKELRAALVPIRRFMTERGKAAGMDERVIFAALEEKPAPKTSPTGIKAFDPADIKPTPAPWFYAYGAVWTTPDGPEDGGECIAMRASDSKIAPTERDRNLRLCAASHALLDALKDCVRALEVKVDPAHPFQKYIDAGHAAIEKATR